MTTANDHTHERTSPDREAADERGVQWELELVRRMVEGSELAFDEFAEEFFVRLYRFAASRLGNRDPAGELTRDIVQSSLCKAIQKISSFRGEARLFTWLCACCRNEILMHFRKAQNASVHLQWGEVDEGALESGREELGPLEEASAKERSKLVHQALDQLPNRYSRALEWKYIERASVLEIAERLAVGPKAAESLLTRARGAFRSSFEAITRPQTVPAVAVTQRKRP